MANWVKLGKGEIYYNLDLAFRIEPYNDKLTRIHFAGTGHITSGNGGAVHFDVAEPLADVLAKAGRNA